MMIILCCTLDSRGNKHQALINSTKSIVSIYSDNQELPTTTRYNLAWLEARQYKATSYMFGANDIEILTPNFEEIAEKYFNDNPSIDIIYPDDGIQGESLCTHPIFRATFLEKIGEFFPVGYMRHCFVDNYIMTLGKTLNNIKYLPELKIKHNHPITYNAAWDEHYLKVYDPSYFSIDSAEYNRCIKEHLPEILQKALA